MHIASSLAVACNNGCALSTTIGAAREEATIG